MQVVQQLNSMFQPDFRVIKKRIEDLIDRDYLERDKDNANSAALSMLCLHASTSPQGWALAHHLQTACLVLSCINPVGVGIWSLTAACCICCPQA